MPTKALQSLTIREPLEKFAGGHVPVSGPPDLEVRVHPDRAGNLRVGLHGELDGDTAPLLEVVLSAADHHRRPGRSPGTVIFDLAGVKFIYMRGIAVLQEVCVRLSRAGWQVSLTDASPNVADLSASVAHGDRTHGTLHKPGGSRGHAAAPR